MVAESGVEARRLAIEALERIDRDGAYANLLVPKMLEESGLEARDRGFVTELVYGTTRMRRAMDFAVDRFVDRDDVEHRVRAALRLGAYQLIQLDTPPHAAVDATVAATPKRARGFVNAVLRRVSAAGEVAWPNEAIRLSYPNWLFDRLTHDLGDRSLAVMAAMNHVAAVHTRDDGYRQDPSSQAVADLVDISMDGPVLDLCAAPGGKATRVAGRGASVVAVDLHQHRAGLVQQAADLTGTAVFPLVADGLHSPIRRESMSAVLVDAPCSGLGSLRRRPDARWQMEENSIDMLAELQFRLVEAAADAVISGGQVVFSICTLTDAESVGVDARIKAELPLLESVPIGQWPSTAPWEPHGRGGRLLPDTFGGDGMCVFVYRRRSG